jgi:DnaJ like chaperone protein
MLFRTILGFLIIWLLLTIVRAVLENVGQRKPGSRRPPAGNADRRRKALTVLGLCDGAKPAEIKRAYRDLAAKYHPDRVAHLGPELMELTGEKFKEINAAYEFLLGRSR